MANAIITFNLSQPDFETIVDMAAEGISYWASKKLVDNTGEGGKYLTYFITDAEDSKEYALSLAKVEQAVLDLHVKQSLNNYYQDAIRHLVVKGDSSEVGSDIADAIIQQACFGSVIYG